MAEKFEEIYREQLGKLVDFCNNCDNITTSEVSDFFVDEDESIVDQAVQYLSKLGYNVEDDFEEEISENEPTELDMAESESFQDDVDFPLDEEEEDEIKAYSEAIENEIKSGDFEEILSTNQSSDDPVKMYFREIGQIPRLTPQEEQLHANIVQQGLAAKQRLDDCELKGIVLSEEERAKLENEVEQGYESREIMINSNYRLVVYIAKRYLGRGLQFLDLIQHGNCGLMKAVTKFDPTKGFKFATYATWWIRQSVTRALADQGRTIRVPVHMVETINKLARVTRQLTSTLKRDPTIDELAKEMKMSPDKIQHIRKISQDPISIDTPVGDEDDSTYGDLIADQETLNPFEFAENQAKMEELEEMLSCLTPREEKVIRLRYGLDDNRSRTLEEVGALFKVTRERIRQIEGKAIERLKIMRKKKKNLAEFYNRENK